jgi:hypothetical protein
VLKRLNGNAGRLTTTVRPSTRTCQDDIHPPHYQQGRWLNLQSRVQRRHLPSLLERLSSPGRHLSWVPLPHMLVLTHSVHAITAQISPVPNSSGLEVLETDAFRLQCFQTHTGKSFDNFNIGTKFLLITEPRQPNVDTVLKRVYELYSDYVMKNPFYQLEMPIRCEEFDRNLGAYAKSIP